MNLDFGLLVLVEELLSYLLVFFSSLNEVEHHTLSWHFAKLCSAFSSVGRETVFHYFGPRPWQQAI